MEAVKTESELLKEIAALKDQVEEYKDLVESIKTGAIDALAINKNGQPNIFSLESNDFIYRVLVENFAESALNVTETGMIIYANGAFETLLNANNSSIIGTQIESFIHPEFLPAFNSLFKAAFSGVSKGESVLAFNNRQIPVYMSFSSLYPRFQGIGIIITDLSEKKKHEVDIAEYKEILFSNEEEKIQYEMEHLRNAKDILEEHTKKIEEKNVELLHANIELTSFTYIASHDLKEPLRKIKLFLNRIIEREDEVLSESTKDDFDRVITAAGRMQDLIEALLSYSQVNDSKFEFIKTDLDTILSEVKNNLQEIIEEKNVVIESSDLPVLNIVPVQFTQLFTNLISNSIKYTGADVRPKIFINAQIISAAEIVSETLLPKEKYWQISFKDNGIGFESQYQDKIFELFQRLHTNDEYKGTGIGLAICKKAVLNHKGIMTATSVPGEGSVFNIYIPVN